MQGKIWMALALVLASVAIASHAATQRAVAYSPTKVDLAGEVVLDRYLGPTKFDAPAISLEQPISLKGGSGEFNYHSFSGIKVIQLVGSGWKKLCGRHVRLQGTLDEPDTTNFDTQVIMTVDRVEWQSAPGKCQTLDHTGRH